MFSPPILKHTLAIWSMYIHAFLEKTYSEHCQYLVFSHLYILISN